MYEPCWCQLNDPNVGKHLDPAHAQYVRRGIPLCSHECAKRYDLKKLEHKRKMAFYYDRRRT